DCDARPRLHAADAPPGDGDGQPAGAAGRNRLRRVGLGGRLYRVRTGWIGATRRTVHRRDEELPLLAVPLDGAAVEQSHGGGRAHGYGARRARELERRDRRRLLAGADRDEREAPRRAWHGSTLGVRDGAERSARAVSRRRRARRETTGDRRKQRAQDPLTPTARSDSAAAASKTLCSALAASRSCARIVSARRTVSASSARSARRRSSR